ncbi:MAG: RNA methyltransferase [Treponemataceae bacterium]|nr:RNA methyltransferase [Treponemataceae bacterium]
MNGQNICVILCHPDESRNVGSVCRAMANNDVKELRIVGRKEDYNEEQVKTLSIHAFYIWQQAKFFESLEDAIKDCSIAAGTTRRRGKKRKDFLCLPDEFARNISNINQGKIAIIFGNERTGLTDQELESCTVGINIPSSEEFGSLNLSHAVQVMLYTLFRQYGKQQNGYLPVSLERLDKTVNCIADNLQKIGFFKVTGRQDMEAFWRGILSRSSLSEGEAQYLEKVFTKAGGLAGKNKGTQD